MFKFFEFIVNLINNIADAFANLVQSVITFFGQIFSGLAFLTETVGYLPPFCQGFLLAVIGVSILTASVSIIIDLT